ncbi:MAG: topology modulation protein [Ruminococcaceae bacterium]|nr:topology modulation protein [Oscillospiraceae bacterium]
MERIIIIGCPGSGKSTLARELGDKLDLPVVHLDRLWWTKGWKNVSREEFDVRLDNALALDSWIIDGNYSRTMDARLAKCDTIIWLDYSRWTCLWGVFQRVLRNFGKNRPDMPEGCPERFDWEFVKYIWNFNKNNRVLNATHIAKNRHAKAVVLKNRREKQAFLESLS